MIISFVNESDGQRKSSYCLWFYSLLLIWSLMITIISRMSFDTLDVFYDGTCICRYISQSRVFDTEFTFKDHEPLVLHIWYFTKSDSRIIVDEIEFTKWIQGKAFLENISHIADISNFFNTRILPDTDISATVLTKKNRRLFFLLKQYFWLFLL